MTIFDSVRMKCRTLLEAVNELFAMGGELEQKVDNQEEELVGVQSAMGDIQTGFSEVRTEMGVLTDRVDTVEQTYDPEQLNTIKGDITAIEGDIQLLTAGVNGTQSRMDDVEESNAQAVATVQQLSQTVSGYDTEIANLKTTDTNTMQQVLAQGVRIGNEITARESGDTALRQDLDTEVQTRSEQVNTLTTNLNDEVTARTNADTTLQNNIDTLGAGVVKLTGDQTVAGKKTFTSPPTIQRSGAWVTMNFKSPTYDATDDTITEDCRPMDIGAYDMNNKRTGALTNFLKADETALRLGVSTYDTEGNTITSGYLGLVAQKNGNVFASAPSSPSTTDNSTKIATTQWVNTASGVVHTTGAETIAGIKTFTNTLKFKGLFTAAGVSAAIDMLDETGTPFGGYFTRRNLNGLLETSMKVTNGTVNGYLKVFIDPDNNVFAQAPATRTTGYTSTDIATAGWVDAKLQALEARITALEGGA